MVFSPSTCPCPRCSLTSRTSSEFGTGSGSAYRARASSIVKRYVVRRRFPVCGSVIMKNRSSIVGIRPEYPRAGSPAAPREGTMELEGVEVTRPNRPGPFQIRLIKFGKQAYCVIEVRRGEEAAEVAKKLRELAAQGRGK